MLLTYHDSSFSSGRDSARAAQYEYVHVKHIVYQTSSGLIALTAPKGESSGNLRVSVVHA